MKNNDNDNNNNNGNNSKEPYAAFRDRVDGLVASAAGAFGRSSDGDKLHVFSLLHVFYAIFITYCLMNTCGVSAGDEMGSALITFILCYILWLLFNKLFVKSSVSFLRLKWRWSPIRQNEFLSPRPHQCRPHFSATKECARADAETRRLQRLLKN